MACARFSFSFNVVPALSGGPTNLQSGSRMGTRNVRYRPCFKAICAVHVSGAELQAAPAVEGRGRMKKPRTLYEVLGLSQGANTQDIKTAYRKLARQFHPDTAASSEDKSISTEMFLQIQNAYAVLSKAEDRAQYDRQLGMQQTQRWNKGAYRKPYGHVVRNWETDQCW